MSSSGMAPVRWINLDEPGVAPDEQADAKNMDVEAMNKMLAHHSRHNHSKTRKRYITYWKEQIANKLLLEELEA